MRIPRKTFRGGYLFNRFRGAVAADAEIIDLGVPERVAIPLCTPTTSGCEPLVAPGDSVRAGQAIARRNDDSRVTVPATISGTVEAIVEHACAGGPRNAAIVRGDGSREWQSCGDSQDWQLLGREALEQRLVAAGATRVCGTGVPTRYGSSAIEPDEVVHVIVSAVQSDMYPIPHELMLRGHPIEHAAVGVSMLQKLMPAARIHVAVDDSRVQMVSDLARSGSANLSFCCVRNKYPQHREEMLVQAVLGMPFPHGYHAINVGVLVLDFPALLHIYEALAEGRPVLDRVIALTGPGFQRNVLVRARVGTPLEAVVAEFADRDGTMRFILNGVLAGDGVDDLSIPIESSHTSVTAVREDPAEEFLPFASLGTRKDSFSRTFLAKLIPLSKSWDTGHHGEPRACISCGFCDDVCPSRILPHLLHRYVRRNMIGETLAAYGINRCIDCNLCTYVCPSKIPVADLLREGKRRLREEGIDLTEVVRSSYPLKGLDRGGSA